MKKIDLQGLMAAHSVDPNELAKRLFPKVSHPYMAMYRVIKNEKSLLDEMQIRYLSSFLDVPVASLFSDDWEQVPAEKPGYFEVIKGDYKAVLNPETGHVKLLGPDLYNEEYISLGPLNLKDYFKFLNNKFLNMNINFNVDVSQPKDVQVAIDMLTKFLTGSGNETVTGDTEEDPQTKTSAKKKAAAARKKKAAETAKAPSIKLDDVKAKVIALGKSDPASKPKMKAKLAELGGEGTRTSTLEAEHYPAFMDFLTALESEEEEV